MTGGYRPGPNGIDALLVGYYDATGLRLRHAAFLGLRSDKSAREVRRERPA